MNMTNAEAQALCELLIDALSAESKRYVTLGDGRKVSLGQYTAAWKMAKALPPDTRVRGSPTATFRDAPNTAGDALAEFREGMHDRINRNDPSYGKGRKWSNDWQGQTRRMSAQVNDPRVRVSQIQPEYVERLAGRLDESAQRMAPKPGGDRSKAPARPITDSAGNVWTKTPGSDAWTAKPRATPQVAPLAGMSALGVKPSPDTSSMVATMVKADRAGQDGNAVLRARLDSMPDEQVRALAKEQLNRSTDASGQALRDEVVQAARARRDNKVAAADQTAVGRRAALKDAAGPIPEKIGMKDIEAAQAKVDAARAASAAEYTARPITVAYDGKASIQGAVTKPLTSPPA